MEVDDLPGDEVAGKDAQLERGVQRILEQLKARPRTLPEPPPALPAYPPRAF